MDFILETSKLRSEYLSSRVLLFSDANPGVEVTFAVYFLLNSSVVDNDLSTAIRNYLRSSGTEFGQTKINISTASLYNFPVCDLDECSYSDRLPIALHDCDPHSVCRNTVGYFECVCGLNYKDEATNDEFKGRNCSAIEREKERAQLEKTFNTAGCTDGTCDTPWDLVLTITGGTFSLLVVLLIIEIVCRTKQLRKQVVEKRRRKSAMLRRLTINVSQQLLDGARSSSVSVDNMAAKGCNDSAMSS